MENNNLKNIVVLKNLPSNLVEEAFVILKSNKKAKKLAKVEKENIVDVTRKDKKEKEYILKEAEMIVSNYLLKIEDNNKQLKNKKYKKLKKYACCTSVIIFIETIMLILL